MKTWIRAPSLNKVLFDTSLIIPFLRKGDRLDEVLRLTRGEILYLSSVVAEEIYAGCQDKGFLWQMDKLYYRFEKAGRLIVPDGSDWRLAGRSLSRLGNRYCYDKIRVASLVNDALIATSCRREGVLLLTINEKDFRLLKEEIDFEYRVPS